MEIRLKIYLRWQQNEKSNRRNISFSRQNKKSIAIFKRIYWISWQKICNFKMAVCEESRLQTRSINFKNALVTKCHTVEKSNKWTVRKFQWGKMAQGKLFWNQKRERTSYVNGLDCRAKWKGRKFKNYKNCSVLSFNIFFLTKYSK